MALCCLAPPQGVGSAGPRNEADISFVGVFAVGAPITGAVLDEEYLYVTTASTLSVYDVSNPSAPELLAARPSPGFIQGELITTQGEILLLNGGLGAPTLDVWNVEDKSNPILTASILGVPDEHVSCLLDCTWAYGSAGSIIDLRDPQQPKKAGESWMDLTGLDGYVHRLDEYRPGYMATAPRGGQPVFLDVRRPLKPRVVAKARVPKISPYMFLYTSWANGGRDRFAISSVENGGECNGEFHGALLTYDTEGWPKDQSFEVTDRYRYRGRTDDENCLAYYFSLHPDFDDGGLLLLPNGLEGTRLLEVDPDGKMEELDSFVLPTSDVWLAFWIDREIFYALNMTGEVYILRYQ